MKKVDSLTESVKSRHPMKTDFSKDRSSPTALDRFSKLWQRLASTFPENVDKYLQADYPAWLREVRDFFRVASCGPREDSTKTPVGFSSRENTGSRPAEKTLVSFRIHGGAQFIPPKDESTPHATGELSLPHVPEPPRGKWVPRFGSVANIWNLRDMSARLGPAIRDRHKFYRHPEKPKSSCGEWSFECEDFRHQAAAQRFDIELSLPRDAKIQSGMIECEVSAANLSEPVVKRIPFNISYKEGDTLAAAQRQIDGFENSNANREDTNSNVIALVDAP